MDCDLCASSKSPDPVMHNIKHSTFSKDRAGMQGQSHIVSKHLLKHCNSACNCDGTLTIVSIVVTEDQYVPCTRAICILCHWLLNAIVGVIIIVGVTVIGKLDVDCTVSCAGNTHAEF